MRISDWSSDVCSSDLCASADVRVRLTEGSPVIDDIALDGAHWRFSVAVYGRPEVPASCLHLQDTYGVDVNVLLLALFAARRGRGVDGAGVARPARAVQRTEETTSDLRSPMRNSYA